MVAHRFRGDYYTGHHLSVYPGPCHVKREERERSSKRKPLVAGDVNLTFMLR